MSGSPLSPVPDSPNANQPLPVQTNHNGQLTMTPTIKCVRPNENSAITRTQDSLNDENWTVWQQRLLLMLQICGVQNYITRGTPRPDVGLDPEGAANWDFNDTYTRVLIANNVTTTQMVHIGQCHTASECWSSLEAIHDAKSHQTIIGIIWNLYRASAEDGNNIADHLNKLKRYWERINLIADDDFKVSDNQFKVLISFSLPAEWDMFTEAYIGSRQDILETDLKKLMGSQQFIGVIKEEAICRDT